MTACDYPVQRKSTRDEEHLRNVITFFCLILTVLITSLNPALEKAITLGFSVAETNSGVTSLKTISNEMQQSPALDFLKSFELSALSMNDLMTKIFTNPNEEFAYHLGSYHEQIGTVSRRAVCEWVYDNLDDLIEAIPSKYPRFFRPAEEDQTLRKVGLGLSIFTLVLIWITAVLGFTLEIKETMKILRVDCWIWVLIGEW